MSEELKPCPFCGGRATIKVNSSTMNAQISCPACAVVMKRNFKGSERIAELLTELIAEAWNRRDGEQNAD